MRRATFFACCLAFAAIIFAQSRPAPPQPPQDLDSEAVPPPPKPVPQGTLHVYRLKLEVAHATHPTVSCDNFPIVRLPNGRVYTMKFSEGTHTLLVGDNPDPLNLEVAANKDYYVRIDYPVNAATGSRPSLVVVAPDEAKADIKELRRVDPVYIEAATCGRP